MPYKNEKIRKLRSNKTNPDSVPGFLSKTYNIIDVDNFLF